ncbi:MAG: hypothetical protein KIT09_08990 [Bryobacteraceae bacterium]|nr:hypothetical protein [Bryobacteraceae bacterium]
MLNPTPRDEPAWAFESHPPDSPGPAQEPGGRTAFRAPAGSPERISDAAGVVDSDVPARLRFLDGERLRRQGREDAGYWQASLSNRALRRLRKQQAAIAETIMAALEEIRGRLDAGGRIGEVERWLHENSRLLKTGLREVREGLKELRRLPEITGSDPPTLRAEAAAQAFLSATGLAFDEDAFTAYFRAVQETCPWPMAELWALKPLLQHALFERIAEIVRARKAEGAEVEQASLEALRPTIVTLKRLSEEQWLELVEEISEIERILRSDPDDCYAAMDFASRDLYRGAVTRLAHRSSWTEVAIAMEAVRMARKAREHPAPDRRMAERRGHVGYYLVDKGRDALEKRLRYRTTFRDAFRRILLKYPTPFYLLAMEIATIAVVVFTLAGIGFTRPPWLAVVILLLPASEAAIAMVNRLVTWLLPPRVLPKLDFKSGIPSEYTTMTVVPTLLINEEQVRETVEQFEIRYLANRQPNLYFALLTDAPDSTRRFDEKDELANLCARLVEELNRKYSAGGENPFFMLHRHRVYYDSEGAWLGWERKRGKLLDLNNLLRGGFDSFPVKVCDDSVLPKVRYVITLDADTQLPKDAAHRLAGTMAHPLNRAVIDPATNTVVEGYAILQPRIGVSVHSAGRSRLAAIFSGETGFDIYTRAVSEVYQDLFGEGSFTGKGIYEVDTFQAVLAQRFPENALLSHDLIEGAHARAGLASDIELIDDYPTRFSAYSRRKHRWVRGDWQIMLWLLPRVPDYFGRLVPNPITTLSRWKILDNLRRSLMDVSLFALLVAGWLFLPGGALSWTIATLVLLMLPSYFELLLVALGMPFSSNRRAALEGALDGFLTRQVNVLFTLAFLSHQALMMADAVVRTVVRMAVTKQKLLEWETAAQAESAVGKRTPVEKYLDWTPWLSLGLLALLAIVRPDSISSALPVLALWAAVKPLVRWLDRPLPVKEAELTGEGVQFLRGVALRTWRYFHDFGGPAENWLIPDNALEEPERVASRISPTNLGMLLNARVAAHDLGYLPVPELVRGTEATLATMKRLRRYRGHYLNWYATRTLEPLAPLFVSTVDSGNLAASLWTLKQALLELKARPPIETLWRGVVDHAELLREVAIAEAVVGPSQAAIREMCRDAELLAAGPGKWWEGLFRIKERTRLLLSELEDSARSAETRHWADELAKQIGRIEETARLLTPWALPEARALVRQLGADVGPDGTEMPLEAIPGFAASLRQRVPRDGRSAGDRARASLAQDLERAGEFAASMLEKLDRLAAEAESFVNAMDFRFLYNEERKLLAVGFDAEAEAPHRSYYDLLASEARTALFIAIAKGDVPQESWFHLGRGHVLCRGERVLLSWTGTMFEYLMPFLWMRAYPNTVLARSAEAAVRVQQGGPFVELGRHCGPGEAAAPWGISEAACAERNGEGDYMYKPFGVSGLALKARCLDEPEITVVAPYATFLALGTDLEAALPNLRAMEGRGWIGRYGFYEAVQFGGARNGEVVRSWMAHHQGMILLAIANAVMTGRVQRYFHAEPAVQATELLLQEKTPAVLEAEPAE